jgi:diketogulonate reductase-like aldo/keto reductase
VAPGDDHRRAARPAHLRENLRAQSIALSPQEMRAIDDIAAPADADRVVTS